MADRTTFEEMADGDFIKEGYLNRIPRFVARQAAFNIIRQLKDRSITLCASGGEFAEAYTDSTGRLDSVNTGSTDANYVAGSGSYRLGSTAGSTEQDTTAGTSESSANLSISVTISATGYFSQIQVERAVVSDVVVNVKKNGVIVATDTVSSGGLQTVTFTEADYDEFLEPGDTVVIETTTTAVYYSTDTYSGTNFSFSSQNVPTGRTSGSGSTATIIYTPLTADSTEELITHDIPTGTFSSTISSAYCEVLHATYESGSNVQFKLTNGTDDTGWLNCGTTQIFTAFAAGEPTQLILKLVPKSVSPTAGYPNIYGVAAFEQKDYNS